MKILCPTCKKTIEYDLNNSFRPFCNDKCRLIDLGAWASEEYKISAKESEGGYDEKT
jgi:endogenous inhibitor of DNA gyrase (YacG/DUF329 family)|tara:strand:- start:1344 stop:1514 length:171 start_codon:yes stop_codon:yes gene_type:complete